VINGGIINSYGSNARLGDSDWMVVEADESDGVPASGWHHRGRHQYRSRASRPLRLVRQGEACFVEFIENVPFYGAAMLCIDHPKCRRSSPRCATAASSPMVFRAGRRAR
jgi:UDP-N-acetylmuramate--alanine ligase